MGAIEDTRKVLQDFLAPELRAISTRLDALEKRFDDSDRRAERRHDEVMVAIRQVMDLNSIQQRLTRLEAKAGSPQ
jgi:SMC interacting uncharacterized protein involved in chromosome segregation